MIINTYAIETSKRREQRALRTAITCSKPKNSAFSQANGEWQWIWGRKKDKEDEQKEEKRSTCWKRYGPSHPFSFLTCSRKKTTKSLKIWWWRIQWGKKCNWPRRRNFCWSLNRPCTNHWPMGHSKIRSKQCQSKQTFSYH